MILIKLINLFVPDNGNTVIKYSLNAFKFRMYVRTERDQLNAIVQYTRLSVLNFIKQNTTKDKQIKFSQVIDVRFLTEIEFSLDINCV